MRGAKEDIGEIARLLKTMQQYRSTFGNIKNMAQKVQRGAAESGPEISEGLLGRVPEKTESIAELMLFDSDVNVYGDSNIYIEDFDIRSRKMVAIPKGKKYQQNYMA